MAVKKADRVLDFESCFLELCETIMERSKIYILHKKKITGDGDVIL